jgi:hypothetical protein
MHGLGLCGPRIGLSRSFSKDGQGGLGLLSMGFLDLGWACLGLFGEIPSFLACLGLLNTCHLSLCFLNIRPNKFLIRMKNLQYG